MLAVIGDHLRQVARVDRGTRGFGLILVTLGLAEHGSARREALLIRLSGARVDVLRHLIRRPRRARLRACAVEDELDEAAAHLAAARGCGVADLLLPLDLLRIDLRRGVALSGGGENGGKERDSGEQKGAAGH